MKLQLDLRFLTTAAATFVIIVVAVALLSTLVSTAAATAGAAVLAGIAIKLFDKLDYSPSLNVELGGPRISVSWLCSAMAAIFVVYGSTVVADIAASSLERADPAIYPCALWQVLPVAVLDWAGFVVAGWLLGRIFPNRALTLSSIGAFVFVLAALLEVRSPEKLDAAARCVLGPRAGTEDLESARTGMGLGFTLGIITRGYVSIAMARFVSRRVRTTGESTA